LSKLRRTLKYKKYVNFLARFKEKEPSNFACDPPREAYGFKNPKKKPAVCRLFKKG
jgi:hypothetical protein